jgi:phage/plasmid-like protein (TIGR03299 family)
MTTMTHSFTSRDLPWMKVGHVINDPTVTAEQAARLGGIDFDVAVYDALFSVPNDDASPSRYRVPNRRAVVRKDTREFFDYVSEDYRVVQYRDAFTFMNEIKPLFVAAGALNGGRQGFMVVQFEGHETFDPMPGGESDPHDLYVVLRTSHDRSKALEVAVLPLRQRCMNQLGLASLTRGVEQRWSIHHIGDPLRKLAAAQNVLTRTERYADAFDNAVHQLTSVRVDRDLARQLVRRVLPDRPKRDEQVTAIEAAFTSSPNVGFTGTGWGLVNAVSEHLEHGRTGGSRTAQSRFVDGLAGQTAKYVSRVAHLLLNRA